MNIYQRLKLNDTFKLNIELIHNYKKIEEILKNFEAVKKIENSIENLKFEKELGEIEEEIKAINQKIIIFDRAKIFNDISQKDFFTKIKNEFDEVNLINVSDKEITDFYFFAYLLKNSLYDEKFF